MPVPQEWQRQLRQLAKAAQRADKDTGFAFLRLCEPTLVLVMIAALRESSAAVPADLDRMAALAKAAAGKRAVSDEGMAFADACTPCLILNWCRMLGAS